MPKVTFISDKLVVEVPVGSKVTDVVDQAKATVPFGCRMGSCGTCRVVIEKGMQNLNSKTREEEDLFDNFTSVGEKERLACQLVIQGDVTIRS